MLFCNLWFNYEILPTPLVGVIMGLFLDFKDLFYRMVQCSDASTLRWCCSKCKMHMSYLRPFTKMLSLPTAGFFRWRTHKIFIFG